MQASLNFLSPEKKAVLRKGFLFAYAQNMLFILCLVVVTCSGMLLALRLMLAETRHSMEAQTAGGLRDVEAVTAEITAVNAYVGTHDAYARAHRAWSDILAEITGTVQPRMSVGALRVDATGRVEISGLANERADVLRMKTALEASPSFKDVVSPRSNIEREFNVTWSFSFQLKDPPTLPEATEKAPVRRGRRGAAAN